MKKFLMEGKKVGGYVLLETVLAMIAFSMLSMAFFTIFSGQFSMINSSADAMQAQQYAEIDAQQLRLMNYYDLEDEGAKSRSAMTSWSNPDNLWEDEITIGNEIVIDDYTQSKQRIATIKIYRQGDTLPRFSFEVPVSSQGSGVPIGSIIAWGVESNPSYDGGTYLECDGSTFDTNKYKRLYEVLGTNRVPDYRGLFLRGWGSQTVSDDKLRKITEITINGDETKISLSSKNIQNVKHSSGDIGEIQHDTIRNIAGHMGHMQESEALGGSEFPQKGIGNCFFVGELYNSTGDYPFMSESSFPKIFSTERSSSFSEMYDRARGGQKSDLSEEKAADGWYDALTKYRYKLEFVRSLSETGDSFISDVNLVEEEEHPTLVFGNVGWDAFFDASQQVPTSEEVRPVNTAVKFMIKAK